MEWVEREDHETGKNKISIDITNPILNDKIV